MHTGPETKDLVFVLTLPLSHCVVVENPLALLAFVPQRDWPRRPSSCDPQSRQSKIPACSQAAWEQARRQTVVGKAQPSLHS